MIKEIKLQNITKEYEDEIAVSSFSLCIKENDFVVIVGPSGSGKSSLLKMIYGSEKITEGELFFDNKKINNVATIDRDVEIVFQHYAIDYDISVEKNIIKSLKKKKLKKQEIKERVLEIARILEIEDLLNSDPKNLSGGEKQRVALARALVCRPSVLLLDEPLSNLYSSMRNKVRNLLKKYHRIYKNIIIYVTHDQNEAMVLGNKVVVIKDGQIQQIGSPLELYHKPSNPFVASFIGNPSANVLEGKIKLIKDNYYFEIANQDILIPTEVVQKEELYKFINRNIVICVRPNLMNISNVGLKCVFINKEVIGESYFLDLKIFKNKKMIKIQLENDIKIDEKEELFISFNWDEVKIFSEK